jgi:hypothetical protein
VIDRKHEMTNFSFDLYVCMYVCMYVDMKFLQRGDKKVVFPGTQHRCMLVRARLILHKRTPEQKNNKSGYLFRDM